MPAHAVCPPQGSSRESLQALKQRDFAVADAASRNALALALVGCLPDPDPALRDGVGYEALAHWMRAGELDAATLRELRARLGSIIDGGEGDGFARPFAALALAEMARTDRVAPWMTPPERDAMVAQAAAYVETVQDYRGFDDAQGWRHGVAHGADWLMQLALHPALARAQADRILAAVAAQVAPAAGHAYVHGEPGRLARPVLFVARHRVHSDAEWQEWFAALASGLGDPGAAGRDAAWLARRHDLVAFLQDVYLESDTSTDTSIHALNAAALAALEQIR